MAPQLLADHGEHRVGGWRLEANLGLVVWKYWITSGKQQNSSGCDAEGGRRKGAGLRMLR